MFMETKKLCFHHANEISITLDVYFNQIKFWTDFDIIHSWSNRNSVGIQNKLSQNDFKYWFNINLHERQTFHVIELDWINSRTFGRRILQANYEIPLQWWKWNVF